MPKSKKVEVAEAEREKSEKEKEATEHAIRDVKVRAMKIPLLSKNGVLVNQEEIHDEIVKEELAQKSSEIQIIPPQIAFYDNIFGRMLKICLNYSKEVD